MNRFENLVLAAFMVLAIAVASQAESFGVNWPTFKDSTPAELGEPSITFIRPGYDKRDAYYDGKTRAYWWFNNGRWAGYFVQRANGYDCWELRGNGRVGSRWIVSDQTEQLPDGYVKISGYVQDFNGNNIGAWWAVFKP